MIRVFIVDDHVLIRDGLRTLLAADPLFEVVGEASNGQELLDHLPTVAADVVLLDLNMPVLDGLATTHRLRAQYPHLRVLLLSMMTHEHTIGEALAAGAHGYVLKNAGKYEIVAALQGVAAGKRFLCSEIGLSLLERVLLLEPSQPAPRLAPGVPLTHREREILRLVAAGLTNQQIADQLFTSRRTVESHRQHLLEKTGVRNTPALVKYAVEHGFSPSRRLSPHFSRRPRALRPAFSQNLLAMTTPLPVKTQKPHRDIVVIGASAGGVTAPLALVKTLPADFPAPIFIVQHVAADSPSILPQLLSSVSALAARHPQNGETVAAGVIYVAPPDHHLLLEGDRVLVTRGPKENRFRPSIDALFRSAAYTYGPRVIGVVLTGYLDDGTSGLWSVQRMGGRAVVQAPHDAEQPSMPTNALEFVAADYVVPLAQLGGLLERLTQERAPAKTRLPAAELDLLKIELTIAKQGGGFELGIIDKGKLTPLTCPDCHGALTQLIEGQLIRYRCHTGHAYTVSALLSEVTQSVESLLYQSMRGLEETKMLLQNLGRHFADNHQEAVAKLFFRKADETGQQARVVHDSILKHEALSGDLQFERKKLA